jgi:predicted dehydrogenase/putative sterol carrier protein
VKKLLIGIIGAGRISDLHVEGYRHCPEAQLYAVCDKDPELAESRRVQWGAVKSFTDYRDLLADPAVDAVDILTPHHLHEKMVIDALKAGKHVAVQKPLSVDLKSADRMIAAAEASGRIFKVTENYIFYPPIRKAAELIKSGIIGEPQNIRINLIGAGSGGWEIPDSAWAWRMREFVESRGMETFDHGHHLWSTVWFLMGSVREVSAWIDNTQGMIDAPAVVMWKHSKPGRYGTCTFSYSNGLNMPSDYYANDEWIDITGARGIIRINRCTGRLVEGPVLSWYDGNRWTHDETTPSDWQEGFTGAMKNFIGAILGNQEPGLSGAQAREILAFNLAVQRSSDKQRSVFLEEIFFPRKFLLPHRHRNRNKKSILHFKSRLLRESRGGDKYGSLAIQSEELTLALPARSNREKLQGWEVRIGLELTEATGVTEYLYISDGEKALIEKSPVTGNENLVITVNSGLWAALLLGRRKLQTAYLQGKLKFRGDMDCAFKLKEVLDL